jgi:UDPglucose--hexose-1-phosphate uridylyltransferase
VPELRTDPVTGRLVLLAPGRAARPYTVAKAKPSTKASRRDCPFCPGNESMTPPEITRTGDGAPGTPGWRVRLFPNLYPFAGGDDAGPGATGAHEVVVLSPDHGRSFAQLTGDEPFEVMGTLRDRSRALAGEGHAYVQVLINQGRAAGASIDHPHAQIVALDFVPPVVQAAVARFRAAGAELVIDDATGAFALGRGVLEHEHGEARAWCPWGSGTPFEVRVALAHEHGRFADATDEHVRALADALRDTLARLAKALGDPPYNVVVHTAAARGDDPYHWWVEVVPRIGVVAGFEIGTGVLVNTTPPEQAAAALRDASAG